MKLLVLFFFTLLLLFFYVRKAKIKQTSAVKASEDMSYEHKSMLTFVKYLETEGKENLAKASVERNAEKKENTEDNNAQKMARHEDIESRDLDQALYIRTSLEKLNNQEVDQRDKLLGTALMLRDKTPLRDYLERNMKNLMSDLDREDMGAKANLLKLAYFYGIYFPSEADTEFKNNNEILLLTNAITDEPFRTQLMHALNGASYQDLDPSKH